MGGNRAIGAFVVYIAIGIIAWWQLAEAKQLRREQARPVVLVDLEPRRGGFIWLVVENSGRTMAYDVQFAFDAPLVSEDAQRTKALADSDAFKHGFATLPPGRTIRMYFDRYASRVETDLPMAYDVTVSYKGLERGRWWKKRDTHRETYRIDLTPYAQGVGERELGEELSRVNDRLAGIKESVRTLAARFPHFSSPFSSPIPRPW